MSTPGEKKLVRMPSGNEYMMVRGASVWEFLSPSPEDQAYVLAHPIPAPLWNPFRSHIYLAPMAGETNEATFDRRATSNIVRRVSNSPFGWTTIRLHMCNIGGTPIAPEGIWFGLKGVGNEDPVSADTWVAATGLVAPPAGTDDEPGVGPVCAYATLPSNTDTSAIVVRIQMPAGTYTLGNLPTSYELIPDFASSYTRSIDGSILGDPTTSVGWNEAYGQAPWFVLELAGLDVPQCVLGAVGDSHVKGYRADAGGQGTRGMLGEMTALMGAKKLNISNFGRTGHNAVQISKRLHAFESAFDIGGWLHERASVNDRDEYGDYLVSKADATFALLQADYAYLLSRSKLMIPMEGAGANGGPAGWYDRFNVHRTEEEAAWPAHMYNASSILNTDGSYKTDMVGPDNGHPSLLGYQTWAPPSWASLQAALTALGVEV